MKEELKIFIKENKWLTKAFMSFGWGNGYVLLPKTHPLHGKNYNDIDVDVHGGLTLSELIVERDIEGGWGEGQLDLEDVGKWCVGFDTAHAWDNSENWTKEDVLQETERLRDQLNTY